MAGEAKPDMYNKGYMNMLIDKVRKEALAELDEQEVFLKRVIYELGKIWRGDEVKAMGKLAEIKVEKKRSRGRSEKNRADILPAYGV